jgi:hypothetical protein
MMTLVTILIGAPAQADDFKNLPNYGDRDYCLDVDTNSNFWVQLWSCDNGAVCLDLQWNNTSNGTPIWLWPCTDEISEFNPAQLWML